MTGTEIGALRTAAIRVGLSVDDYRARISAGQKWCTGCKAWHDIRAFPRDRTRGDGRRAKCLVADHGRSRWPRDPQRERARRAVAYQVRLGNLLRPDALACRDCGHVGADRRHEYDHYLGYEPSCWLSIEPVCTVCHAEREIQRRASDGG